MSLQDTYSALATLTNLLNSLNAVAPSLLNGLPGYDSVADLQADAAVDGLAASLAVGKTIYIRAHGGFLAQKVNAGLVHYSSASGADFRVTMDTLSPLYFGGVGDGVADDTAALTLADGAGGSRIDLGGRDWVFSGTWAPTTMPRDGRVIDDTKTFDYLAIERDQIASLAEATAGTPGGLLPDIDGVSAMISAALAGQLAGVGGRMTAIATTAPVAAVNAWTQREIDTLEGNTITGASLVNDQIILPAGIFLIRGEVSARMGGERVLRCRLRDITNNVTLCESLTLGARADGGEVMHVSAGRHLLLSQATTIELQYYNTNAVSLGYPTSINSPRFASIEVDRIG